MQEGAAAAIERARALLQQDDILSHSNMDAGPPRLPMLQTPPHSNAYKTTRSEAHGTVSNSRGDGRLGGDLFGELQLPNGMRIGSKERKDSMMEGLEHRRQNGAHVGSEHWRGQGTGDRASVLMEDGSELSVDPRTGRVLTDGSNGLELL